MVARVTLALLGVLAAGPRVNRATVEARLRGHDVPADAAAWRALGPGADEALAQIAGDTKAEIGLRARAVSALEHFPGEASRRFLNAMVEAKARSTDGGDRLLLRKAALALGWLGGGDAPPRLGPLLEHDDPEVRVDAALALGLTRLPAAADLLRKRLDVEPAARVRAQMARQLRVIEDALAAATPRDAGARR